jgi:hypothetical protein
MRFLPVFVITRYGAVIVTVRVLGNLLIGVMVAVSAILGGMIALILVMTEHHALPGHDGSHPLEGDSQRKQRSGKYPEETFTHLGKLYDSRFEPAPVPRFRHPAHFG